MRSPFQSIDMPTIRPGEDLRTASLEDQAFRKNCWTGCNGEDASFRRSTFTDCQIVAAKGERASFRGAAFDECVFSNCSLGPRTLDLSLTTWRGAKLREVRFDFASLSGADFAGAELSDVYFRAGNLDGVSFRGASLRKVSFEKAVLRGTDFTGARFFKMDRWGEPDWTGAIIADELRYQSGELSHPAARVATLLAATSTPPAIADALRRLQAAHADLLAAPECMLIGRELEDIIPPGIFPELLKRLKETPPGTTS